MAENKAKELLWPANSDILVRFVFLYVGQGSSTIILVKDGDTYKSMLVDINLDSENGGVNVPILISDLLDGNGLDVFINTHPHGDHLRGITELSDKVNINEIWHSGHKPSKQHDDAYNELQKVIKKIKNSGGVEIELEGSKEENTIGETSYYVLAPKESVADDISGEDAKTRDRRIHEQCVVLKFGTGETWVMLPGDADRDAFEKHITKHHKERLNAVVLAASHHGSRDFFHYDEKDEPYLKALKEIGPDYVVISAPTQDKSPPGHPHDDAVEFYKDEVGEDNVLHTGEKRYSYICDVYENGGYGGIEDDKAELVESYPTNGDDNDGESSKEGRISTTTRVDDRPMGRE